MTPRRRLSLDEIGFLVALAAVIFGAFIYLYPASIAGFPINDGGLFYTMIRAIQQNGYRIPEFVDYNDLSIPFAYPPLAFFVGAAISGLLRIDAIEVVRWLPAVVLVGISVAFYALAVRILRSPLKAGIATYLYVCIPRSMTWMIMGGGLTRSLGQLYLVLTAASVYGVFSRRGRSNLALSILFGALVVLTHPEAALHAIGIAALFWLFSSRSKQTIIDAVLIAMGVVLLSAIWWLPAILQFGMAPFASAYQTGLNASLVFAFPLLLTFGEEPMTTLIAALGLIGLVASVAKREYLLPLLFLMPFAIEPRGAANVAILPLAISASIGLVDVVLPGLAAVEEKVRGRQFTSLFSSWGVRLLLAYLGFFLLQYALFAGSELARIRASPANRLAFQWVSANTPVNGHFLVLTGDIELFCDPVAEWFPALTGRVSETTIQGREWIHKGDFFALEGEFQKIQACLEADSPSSCIADKAAAFGLDYEYVYVTRTATLKRFCRPLADQRRGAALVQELAADSGYAAVYETEDVAIFSRGVAALNVPVDAAQTSASVINQVKDSVSRK